MIKLGIDYGTTTTLVSYINQNVPSPIPQLIDISNGGNHLGYERLFVPSVIAVTKQNDFSFGYEAEKLAEKDANDVVLLRSLKRCLSCDRQEGQKSVSCLNIANFTHCIGGKKFSIFNKTYALNDLVTYYLKEIIKLSLTNIKTPNSDVDTIGISVPAIFGHLPRSTIFEIILNIFSNKKTIDIINEPTAAILACQSRTSDKEDGVYVICDVGGGTTDIVAFEKTSTKEKPSLFFFKPSGCQIAGDDIDFALLKYLRPNDPVSQQNLREVRRAKELLTLSREVSIFGNKLTRDSFQQIIKPTLLKIIEVIRKEIKVIFDNYKPYSITNKKLKLNGIYLSGGGSKIPYLKDLIEKDDNISIYGPVVEHIKNDELNKIYSDDLPIVVVALGTSLPKSLITDSVQYMLPYEIHLIVGNKNEIVAPIYAVLPLEFVINKSYHDTVQLIAVDPNEPDKPIFALHDLLSTKDEKHFSDLVKPHLCLKVVINSNNIMRVTAMNIEKPPTRPFLLPWQGSIETALFEKYRAAWRREHGYV